MFVFLLGLFTGLVLVYWMLFGTAATAAPFYRLWNYCLSFFRGRRASKGEGEGKVFGSNTVTWSATPTAFQIEYLTPDRDIGPARALARAKGKGKGRCWGCGEEGHVQRNCPHGKVAWNERKWMYEFIPQERQEEDQKSENKEGEKEEGEEEEELDILTWSIEVE